MQKTRTSIRPFQARTIDNVMNSAIYHLGLRDMTENELTIKLRAKTTNQDWIASVINKCKDYGYIKSDEAFTRHFAETSFLSNFGKSYIIQKLLKRGLEMKLITMTISKVEQDMRICETTLLQNHLRLYSDLSTISREKLVNTLVKRGYSVSLVNQELAKHPNIEALKTRAQIKGSNADIGSEISKLARKGKGKRVILTTLKNKFIDTSSFEATVTKMINNEELDFFSIAEVELGKRRLDLSSLQGRQKAYQFLNTRGFNGDEIKHAIEALT